MVLGYTTDDDGVHLICECNWSRCMGFSATPEEALELAVEHLADAAKPD